MKISELQEILEKAKKEYGDVEMLFKDGYSGFYMPKVEQDFQVKYLPHTIEYYHVKQGFQMFVD